MPCTARLTASPQVYGGGVSFVVYPFVWSSNIFGGASSTSAGDTVASGLSAVFVDCNFSGSLASTRTIGGLVTKHHVFYYCLNARAPIFTRVSYQMLDRRCGWLPVGSIWR
jgi:hypothetical protein